MPKDQGAIHGVKETPEVSALLERLKQLNKMERIKAWLFARKLKRDELYLRE